jgi:hypothetical protein
LLPKPLFFVLCLRYLHVGLIVISLVDTHCCPVFRDNHRIFFVPCFRVDCHLFFIFTLDGPRSFVRP